MDLKYGNPQLWQKEAMDKGSDLLDKVKETGLMEKWKSKIPPPQSSGEVRKAIEELIMLGNAQTDEDKEFVKDAERDMLEIFVKFLKINGVDTIKMEDLERITDQINPITFGLKYHFNYPRPYQLSFSLDIPLFPSQPTDACSPSYPSGHSIDSFVLGGILSKKFPQLSNGIGIIAEKLSKSRLQGGIHFPFDAEFGKAIAEDILDLDFLSL